ncbi:MAG: hypothetical protein Q8L88_09635 [Bacteroidota bacterium]|nr:hypothetical protein [Bacteroidota bacterium]
MKKLILIIVLVTALAITMMNAQKTIPLNLERMVRDAGIIVSATVVKTETGRDSQTGLLATWITLDVHENFFGANEKQITFKQYGGEADGEAFYPMDLPQYKKDEQVILFLTKPSSIGMQSPVGMQQGKFVAEGVFSDNSTHVKNMRTNPELFERVESGKGVTDGLKKSYKENGTLNYGQFAQSIRSLVQQIK